MYHMHDVNMISKFLHSMGNEKTPSYKCFTSIYFMSKFISYLNCLNYFMPLIKQIII